MERLCGPTPPKVQRRASAAPRDATPPKMQRAASAQMRQSWSPRARPASTVAKALSPPRARSPEAQRCEGARSSYAGRYAAHKEVSQRRSRSKPTGRAGAADAPSAAFTFDAKPRPASSPDAGSAVTLGPKALRELQDMWAERQRLEQELRQAHAKAASLEEHVKSLTVENVSLLAELSSPGDRGAPGVDAVLGAPRSADAGAAPNLCCKDARRQEGGVDSEESTFELRGRAACHVARARGLGAGGRSDGRGDAATEDDLLTSPRTLGRLRLSLRRECDRSERLEKQLDRATAELDECRGHADRKLTAVEERLAELRSTMADLQAERDEQRRCAKEQRERADALQRELDGARARSGEVGAADAAAHQMEEARARIARTESMRDELRQLLAQECHSKRQVQAELREALEQRDEAESNSRKARVSADEARRQLAEVTAQRDALQASSVSQADSQRQIEALSAKLRDAQVAFDESRTRAREERELRKDLSQQLASARAELEYREHQQGPVRQAAAAKAEEMERDMRRAQGEVRSLQKQLASAKRDKLEAEGQHGEPQGGSGARADTLHQRLCKSEAQRDALRAELAEQRSRCSRLEARLGEASPACGADTSPQVGPYADGVGALLDEMRDRLKAVLAAMRAGNCPLAAPDLGRRQPAEPSKACSRSVSELMESTRQKLCDRSLAQTEAIDAIIAMQLYLSTLYVQTRDAPLSPGRSLDAARLR